MVYNGFLKFLRRRRDEEEEGKKYRIKKIGPKQESFLAKKRSKQAMERVHFQPKMPPGQKSLFKNAMLWSLTKSGPITSSWPPFGPHQRLFRFDMILGELRNRVFAFNPILCC
ncbi:hypothetical protein CEXT_11111 [Caerostris extrusa]|uniref:Uncharacterized protein n=1 Tax=Caerostris extrusa TaxID=172846 RepID=A0AAV4QC91_CAEEX|nr:hypothetical protein CEXT_11111 [Caerostris extrusa]